MTRDIDTTPEGAYVELPAGFGIAPAVEAAADRWLLKVRTADGGRAYLACGVCDQSVLAVAMAGTPYRVRVVDIQSQLLTHLMQRHGWSREQVGTDGS